MFLCGVVGWVSRVRKGGRREGKEGEGGGRTVEDENNKEYFKVFCYC